MRAHDVTSPNGTRSDPYYWLRDDTRKDPDVLGYLGAENAYGAAMLEPARSTEDQLFAEMRGRVADADVSAPVLDDGYWYYEREQAGKQYSIYARRKGSMTAPEEVLLDGNQLATGHSFYAIGDYAVSRDGTLLAWTDDVVGRNQFTLHVKNLVTGAVLADSATDIAPTLVWANDNETLFYVGKDPTTLREDRVLRHRLGGAHELVYQEKDGSYYVDVAPTKSRRFIAIHLDATTMSETQLVDADHPATAPRVFLPRTEDHLYEVDHVDHRFVIRTNEHAENYRVVSVAEGRQADRKAWKPLVPHRADALVEDIAVYRDFVAASVRIGGLRRVQVVPGKGKSFFIDATDPAYAMTLVDTPGAAGHAVRYAYDSLVAPTQVFELDVDTRARRLVDDEPVPTYDPSKYTSEYVHATAHDGTKIPISVVYRKDLARDGSAPLLVYGYGAYGSSVEPDFRQYRTSLLDRGWVCAIAHVRGGEEMGHAWYEAGKLLHKRNTFDDFVAATEFLVAQKYAAADRVFAEGASAGGLLIGAVANLRPDLYRGLVAWVPFVDVVTTMLDPSIPLVTNEYEEWGDPTEKPAYDYMLGYSPYDNVSAQAYPAMYVRTGLWDSQVQYYEPAKWVAKLRARKTDDHLLVLETDMHAGHGGASGRFDSLREQARAYAFMLHVLGR